jgi:hypothetical protein
VIPGQGSPLRSDAAYAFDKMTARAGASQIGGQIAIQPRFAIDAASRTDGVHVGLDIGELTAAL